MAKFEPIDLELFQKNARLTEKRAYPRAVAVSFNEKRCRIHVELDNGLEFSFPVADVDGLANLSLGVLQSVVVEGAGNALRFPDVDADFSLPGLLEDFLGPIDWSRREARAQASRENGKKGGRPRKTPVETS